MEDQHGSHCTPSVIEHPILGCSSSLKGESWSDITGGVCLCQVSYDMGNDEVCGVAVSVYGILRQLMYKRWIENIKALLHRQ